MSMVRAVSMDVQEGQLVAITGVWGVWGGGVMYG